MQLVATATYSTSVVDKEMHQDCINDMLSLMSIEPVNGIHVISDIVVFDIG